MPDDTNLLEPEFTPHFMAWKANPNPNNTSNILKAMDPIINSAIKTYVGPGSASPTLRSKAKLLMANSLKTYDPSRAKLRTHMMSQLQGLRRLSAKESQILSIPEQVAIELSRVNEAENYLRDKFNRDPSDAEVSDYTGISKKRLTYVRGGRPSYAEGLLARQPETEGGVFLPSVESQSGEYAWRDFVYNDLDSTDQLIMEHSLGMHGKQPLSNQDIARKLMISPGAISQRKAKIQNKLNMREELGVF